MTASAYHQSRRLALPLIVSNLSVPILGMVDTAVVGHLPEPIHLGAVALGTAAISALYFAFGFLRMGTTGLTAQASGAADDAETAAWLLRGLLTASAIGLLLLLATPLLLPLVERVFAPPPEVVPGLRGYLTMRLAGAPASLSLLVVWGWMLGRSDARGPLVVMIGMNALNAVLAVVIVFGFGGRAPGVGLATVLSEYAGLAVALLWIRPGWQRLGRDLPRWPVILAADRLQRLVRVNRDIFIRSVLLQAAFVVFTALGSRQGPVVLAANAVLQSFFQLASYGLDGFAFAAEAMVGTAVGARDRTALASAVRASAVNAGLLALLLTILFLAAGPLLIGLLTDLAPVRASALTFLPWAAILPVVAIWAFLFDGVFFGATRTGELRNAMLGSFLVYLVLVFPLGWLAGNHGLWAALLIFMGMRGLLLFLTYRRGTASGAFIAGSG